MVTISFTVPADKIQDIINAMKGLYPIPTSIVDGGPVNDFTDSAWAKESIRRLVVRDVRRYKQREAIDNLNIVADDGIIA